MVIILQLVQEDFLGNFTNPVVPQLERLLINRKLINLDNHSDPWLIQTVASELLKEDEAKVIIIRQGDSGFENLMKLVHQFPQLSQTKIFYWGKPHPLVEQVKAFKNVEVKTIFDMNDLFRQVTVWS